jgi:hypothetical protein
VVSTEERNFSSPDLIPDELCIIIHTEVTVDISSR